MKNAVLLFLVAVICQNGATQTYFSKLLNTPYPFVGAVLGSIETPDSGFILMHTSFDIFQDTNKIKILKVDKNGETVWAKNYGAAGTAHDQLEIIRTSDSCYVFCGGEWKNDTYSAFLFKINEQGDSIWMQTYNSGFYFGFFNKVIETSTKDLICIGGFDKTPVNGPDPWRQVYIVKTDKDGNLIWQKNYGSSGLNDNGRDIVETPEHDFICSGYVVYPYVSSQFFVYGQLMKIDSVGNVQWVQQYAETDYWQALIEISPTLDGNYLASGEYSNNRYTLTTDANGTGGILLKIDSDGNTLWFKRYGDEILDAGCYDFVELPDSSFVTIGFSHYPDENSTMVKFNNNGDIIWTQAYKFNTSWEVSEGLYDIIHTSDNGFFLCGYGTSPVLNDPLAISKGWILKVDSLGCPVPFCVVATEEPAAPILQGLSLQPNPGNGAVELRWNPADGLGILEVFHLNGTLVLRQTVPMQEGNTSLSIQQHPAGVYLVRLSTASGSITRKLVKE